MAGDNGLSGLIRPDVPEEPQVIKIEITMDPVTMRVAVGANTDNPFIIDGMLARAKALILKKELEAKQHNIMPVPPGFRIPRGS